MLAFQHTESNAPMNPHKPKVLVIDDDENILSAFGDFLKREHCEMIAASNSDEAVKYLSASNIDLLITDIRLKFESGVTFFLHVKELKPTLPIIVITGFPESISEEDLKMYGADYYLLKPLELNKLREVVRKCLHLKCNVNS